MEIERAREMGFCFGVRRAIELVERAAQRLGPLQTLGPIVHNRQVADRLETMGVRSAAGLDDISDVPVVITAHGIAPGVPQMLRAQGLKVIDATCPTVRRAQRAARSLAKAGFYVLIFGDVTHSEVQGLLGWAGERSSATLEPPNMESLPRHIGILSQTTQAQARFDRFVGQLISSGLGKLSELRIVNTICKATQERQDAALELAKRVDLMLVIGGRHSANATHLAESCVSTGVETHHIETAAELDPAWLINRRRIGIAAGTSTPDEVIDEVVLKLKEVV